MATLRPAERTRIWNGFFQLAWTEAKCLFEVKNACHSRGTFAPRGGTLNEEQRRVLGTLVFCTLAIEARANHLIQKLLDDRRISEAEADAAQRIATEQKWFILPKLAGRRRRLRADAGPHQSIKEICTRRNALVHVDFARLSNQLPDPGKMLSLFNGFVQAIEDMNVLLGDARRPRKRVMRLGRFACR
jgi:hypothetical protein